MSIGFTPQFNQFEENQTRQRDQLFNQREAKQQEVNRSLNQKRSVNAPDPYADQKKAFKERKKMQYEIIGIPSNQDRPGGIIGAIDGMINYNAEALAFKALSLMSIDFLLLIFNVPYLQMEKEFELAKERGIAYEVNHNGEWPTIYKTNEKGDLDYDQPYTCLPEEIPMIEVYENGYVYPASVQSGFAAALADFKRDMAGEAVLSKEQRMLLTRTASVNRSEKINKENDGIHRTQREAFAVHQQRAGAPRPVPRGGQH